MQEYSKNTSEIIPTNNKISIYSGELTKIEIAKNSIKIKKAFPSLPPEWFDVLSERLKDNGFSDARLIDAVNYLIDNCPYPTPTIANIISFDKKINLKTYNEILNIENGFKIYSSIRIYENQEKPIYAKNSDIEKYKLKKWN